jgi:hypothetical protein
MNLTKSEYETIRNWMYRNARPIDLAKWQYHFEKGGKENILSILSVYQNEDGGFGYALEADSWNPNSSPIQTCNAIEVLNEIDFYERNHPIIQGILKYLENCRDYKDGYWLSEIPSNNDYAHAPWWTYKEDNTDEWNYNPTAVFLGFILYYGDKDTRIYQEALRSAGDMVKKVLNKEINNMHEIICFITFMEFIKKTDLLIDEINAFEEKLKYAVTTTINTNTKEWAVSYTCKPSALFNTPTSVFYEDNKELAEYECQFLYETRNSDGVWNISWNWGEKYGKEFAISENWWKSEIVIKNMLYLQNFKYLN